MFTPAQTPSERLQTWRNFRQNSSVNTIEEVSRKFADIRIESRYIDYYTPQSWPNVFDIVKDGMFCQSGLTLVIASSLDYYKFIKTKEIEMPVISNFITGAEGLVLRLGNSYINFLPGQIVDEQYVKENTSVYDTHIIAIDKLYH